MIKFLCFIGWHNWNYEINDGKFNKKICKHCLKEEEACAWAYSIISQDKEK
jgi:hypothetical protein